MALTYPQTSCGLQHFVYGLKAVMNHHKLPWKKLVVGKEKHADDVGEHFHVFIGFTSKVKTKNQRLMDIMIKGERRHPHWEKGFKTIAQKDQWISYCKKEGRWHQEGFLTNLFTFQHWKDYRKNKADLDQWEEDAKAQQMKDPYPFQLPDGTIIMEPQPSEKRVNWLIMGPPNSGKTEWIETTFAGKQVYKRPDAKYPFEKASYRQEPVIIYDDISVPLKELIVVSNCYLTETRVYGDSRYVNNYWKKGQRRTIFWLMNPQRLPDFARPGHESYEIFKSRFRFLEAVKIAGRYEWQEMPDSITSVQQAGAWAASEADMQRVMN